jgi:L-asparaginase
MDATLINAAIDAGARGLVIEALGRGNVPPAAMPAIRRAIAAGLPVVLASRCLRGRVFDSYGYEGGGRQLRQLGIIFSNFLNGQKARIKLSLALSLTSDPGEIRALF